MAQAQAWPRYGMVWATLASTNLALPPFYSRSREKPKHPSLHPRKVLLRPPSQTLAREGSEALPGTMPEGEIITVGLYIAMQRIGQHIFFIWPVNSPELTRMVAKFWMSFLRWSVDTTASSA
jgi:hypothetical protein